VNRVIAMRYSDDGGRNWSEWRERDLGAEGDRMVPVTFRRLGFTRHRIYQIRDVSPYRQDILAVGINAE